MEKKNWEKPAIEFIDVTETAFTVLNGEIPDGMTYKGDPLFDPTAS